jgi:hypothetical protein
VEVVVEELMMQVVEVELAVIELHFQEQVH